MISLQVETLHGMVTNVNFGNYANVVWTTMQIRYSQQRSTLSTTLIIYIITNTMLSGTLDRKSSKSLLGTLSGLNNLRVNLYNPVRIIKQINIVLIGTNSISSKHILLG